MKNAIISTSAPFGFAFWFVFYICPIFSNKNVSSSVFSFCPEFIHKFQVVVIFYIEFDFFNRIDGFLLAGILGNVEIVDSILSC
jgi:hypothetical protein